MTEFLQYCNARSKLEDDAADELLAQLHRKRFLKGASLLREGETCKYLYFIVEGLAKTYSNKDGKYFIMRFFAENQMFTVLDSYVSQSPSTFMVVALEDSDIVYIHHDEMEKLCRKHRCIEHFFRNLVSFAALNMMKRINEMLEDDASKRYLNFRNDNYDLMQRISLGDLASYLGITQVSLSRIRAKK